MDENDAFIGFWLKDVPYAFIGGLAKKGNEVANYKDNIRYYDVTIAPDSLKNAKFDNECITTGKYFKTNTAKLFTFNKMNGRVHYWERGPIEQQSKIEIPRPLTPSQRSALALQLEPFNDKVFDISALICANRGKLAANTNSFENMLDILGKCPPASKCDPCTRTGYKIAKSLIKIAALRIFADPEQSIIELPVNSIDAYHPNKKVGKFGMGFFSIFYWLIGHPKRFLTIHSFNRDVDGAYSTFRIIIREVNDVLTFSLRTYPYSEITSTGFRVDLDATADEFPWMNVQNFASQLSKLRFVKDTYLSYKNAGGAVTQLNVGDAQLYVPVIDLTVPKNFIACELSSKKILVEDFATGMNIVQSLTTLLEPSVSSKTLKASGPSLFGHTNNSRIIGADIDVYTLIITVGTIGVVSISLKNVNDHAFLIDLPASTRVPVSRDDIIFDDATKKYLGESIDTLFLHAETNMSDVSSLQKLLGKYIDYTADDEIKRFVTFKLDEYFQKRRDVLVPHKYAEIYRKFTDKFIESEVFDILAIEHTLDITANPRTNVWYGIKVLTFGADAVIKKFGDYTQAGLINYLFISQQYITKIGGQWPQTLASAFVDMKLSPIGGDIGDNYEKYANHPIPIHRVPDTDKLKSIKINGNQFPLKNMSTDITVTKLTYAAINKFESMVPYFKLLINWNDFADVLAKLYVSFSNEHYVTIVMEIIKQLSSYKGNQTYGGHKHTLMVDTYSGIYSPLPDGSKISIDKQKYDLDNIIASIRASDELPQTFLSIGNRNNIYTLNESIPEATNLKVFFQLAVKYTMNLVELSEIMGGYGIGITGSGLPEAKLKLFVADVVQKIKGRRLDFNRLTELYRVWTNQSYTVARQTKVILKRDEQAALAWMNSQININDIKIYAAAKPSPNSITFNLSQLISSVFEMNLPEKPNVKAEMQFFQNVAANKTTSKMQLVEIAVNEGTTKPVIEAVITELTQNSIDVIRETNVLDAKLEVTILVRRSSDNSKVYLSIHDVVGMNHTSFIAMAIPFWSTKTPSEMVTGEMGSGFFNVYRNTTKVIIDTVRDGIARRSVDVPIRDDKNRVVDIQKMVNVFPVKTGNGTLITMEIPIKDEFEYVATISKIAYFVKNVLALIKIKKTTKGVETPINILFNCDPVDMTVNPGINTGYFQISYTDPNLTKHESYLLTKNIPFAPLKPYFKEFLSSRLLDFIENNIIVNITHGGYTPVQTRTRLSMTPAVRTQFAALARNIVFIAAAINFNNHHTYMLDHFTSHSMATDLRFTEYNIVNMPQSDVDEGMIFKYHKFDGQPSIVEIINGCINIMQNDPFSKNSVKIYEYIRMKFNSSSSTINGLVHEIMADWLKVKNKKRTTPVAASKSGGRMIKVKDADKVADIPHPEFEPVFKKWIATFYTIAKRNNVIGYGKAAPAVKVVYSVAKHNYLGWYDHGDNTITINIYSWTPADRKKFSTFFFKGNSGRLKPITQKAVDDLINHKFLDHLFSYQFPSCTLVHELEHYRRKDSHDSSHDSAVIKLFDGDQRGNESRTFDQVANAVYQHVLANGFWNEYNA